MVKLEICEAGSFIKLEAERKTYRFHAIWLRDNSLDEQTRDPINGQRLITLGDIPKDIRVDNASVEGEEIVCSFSTGEKVFRFPINWLIDHAYDRKKNYRNVRLPKNAVAWGKNYKLDVPSSKLSQLETDSTALRKWLTDIQTFGFAKVTGIKTKPEEIFRIVNLFGFVRETNYGRLFEVRTEVKPVNLAYTGLGLQAHTDNPYRDPVPTIQVLSCLENSAEGGESMVVDGFGVAITLQEEDPEGFKCLSEFPARFSYEGSKDVSLHSKRPAIELGPDNEILCIRFNSRSASPLIDIPFDLMESYYRAYKRLSELVDDPENQVEFKLKPGEAFLVDNTRVLHSRKSFSGTGNRWLQGCYADKDSLLSKLSSLEKASE